MNINFYLFPIWSLCISGPYSGQTFLYVSLWFKFFLGFFQTLLLAQSFGYLGRRYQFSIRVNSLTFSRFCRRIRHDMGDHYFFKSLSRWKIASFFYVVVTVSSSCFNFFSPSCWPFFREEDVLLIFCRQCWNLLSYLRVFTVYLVTYTVR